MVILYEFLNAEIKSKNLRACSFIILAVAFFSQRVQAQVSFLQLKKKKAESFAFQEPIKIKRQLILLR